LNVHRAELIFFIRRQGKKPSPEQRVQINRKRESLTKRIDTFNNEFKQLFPTLHSESKDLTLLNIPYGEEILGEHETSELLADVPRGDIEKASILLPSTCPPTFHAMLGQGPKSELELRIAQADNALEGVRREIGHKSFLFRNNIALSVSRPMKLRGYDAVQAADDELRRYVRIYKQARNAMSCLSCPPDLMKKYQELHTEELKALKSIYDPNSRGQGTFALPWFWVLRVGGDSDSSEYMEERKCNHLFGRKSLLIYLVYRVNWMRARAKFLRWQEESILVPSEMTWTKLFFENRARGWATRALISWERGQKAYAYKQEAMWKELALQAHNAFSSCLIRYVVPGDDRPNN